MPRRRRGLGLERVWLREKDGACAYCGEPADTIDHVIPHALLEAWQRNPFLKPPRYPLKELVVPACGECNYLLGSAYLLCVTDRRRELADKMRKRYAKVLAVKDWTRPELDELTGRLRDYVERQQALRVWLRERIAILSA